MAYKFKIDNPEEDVSIEISEILILDTIRSLEGRNKKLQDIWIKKYEVLIQKRFRKDMLDY